jgi:hypothetical protein
MDKDGVLRTLRAHEPELKAAGIVHLRLFGSVARGHIDDRGKGFAGNKVFRFPGSGAGA